MRKALLTASLLSFAFPAVAQFGPNQTRFRDNVKSWAGTLDVHGVGSGTVTGPVGTAQYTTDQHVAGNLDLNDYDSLTGAWTGTLTGTIVISETSVLTAGCTITNTFTASTSAAVDFRGAPLVFNLTFDIGSDTWSLWPSSESVNGTETSVQNCGGQTSTSTATVPMRFMPIDTGEGFPFPATGFDLIGTRQVMCPGCGNADSNPVTYTFTFDLKARTSPCTYSLSTPSQSFGPGAASGSVSVNTDPSCPWTVTLPAPWVTVTSSTEGTGPGKVDFNVSENPGSNRSTTMSIGGVAFVISQSGPGLYLPVALDNVAGIGGSRYTTELTLASKAAIPVQVDLRYTASVGSGSGSVQVTLAPGETRIIPNTISFLRSQGLPIPTSGSAIGTLLAAFGDSSSDPFIGGRTFTTGGGGTFGLFYPAAATTTTTATLVGLQQNDSQRSNVALVNAGGSPVTLRVQLVGPMGEDLGTLPDESLLPWGWAQINEPLGGKAVSGRAVVTETSGSSPFTAYAVLNDAATSDGSFVPPLIPGGSGPADRLVPIVLDVHGLGGSHYTTELTLANLTASPLPVILVFKASLGSGSGQAALTLAPGEQRIVPDAIGFLRSKGLDLRDDGGGIGGSLLVSPPSGTGPSAFAVGARTFTPASSGAGTFGLYYPGLTLGESAASRAIVNGLQQNGAQRSNVAVVNRGDASDSITLNVSYFDGTGTPLGAPTSVTLAPGQWTQFNQPLQALGAASGFARIEKTSGGSHFVAYGVLNDAATSDGSYIPMSF